jgi:hypothetical protein
VFLFSETSTPVLGPTQPPKQWVPGFFPEDKRPLRDVDPSLPSSAEVKNGWKCTSAPHICLQGVERENITLLTLTYFKWSRSFRFSRLFIGLCLKIFYIS